MRPLFFPIRVRVELQLTTLSSRSPLPPLPAATVCFAEGIRQAAEVLWRRRHLPCCRSTLQDKHPGVTRAEGGGLKVVLPASAEVHVFSDSNDDFALEERTFCVGLQGCVGAGVCGGANDDGESEHRVLFVGSLKQGVASCQQSSVQLQAEGRIQFKGLEFQHFFRCEAEETSQGAKGHVGIWKR